jgi:GNAT superfamily N-acetyltransferase
MSAPVVLRSLQIGDIGWVVHRQGILYAQEYGWDGTFEALVADIAGQFVKNWDPEKENAWIAECEGRVVGSVFVVKVSDHEAKLRLLYVEPEMRGTGLGRRLTHECIAFAKARGYQKLSLWTNDILHAARHIYQTAGFVLLSEEAHHSFGHDLVGQYWALDLQADAGKETS